MAHHSIFLAFFCSDFRTFIELGCFSLLFRPSIYFWSFSCSHLVYTPRSCWINAACNISYIFFVRIQGLCVEEWFEFFLWDFEDYTVLAMFRLISNPIHIPSISSFRLWRMHIHCNFLLAIVAYLLMPLKKTWYKPCH